jgi:hypothetical protein
VPRLLILLAVAAVIYILYLRARGMPPHKRRGELVKLGLGVTVVVAIFLTATGRMHWVGAALTGLLVTLRQSLPLLLRYFPMLSGLLNKGSSASKGQTSTVETTLLRMLMDHDTGNLEGEVLQGNYAKWRLQDMDRAQLQELLAFCQGQDNDSAQLLEGYLQQRFPGEKDFSGGGRSAPPNSSGMNRSEAMAVLGLAEDASDEDIVAAHRSLIQKLHPDRGGNDYLAAKINQAKDYLLG